MNEFLEIGALVRNPRAPEWGTGQVQSIVRGKITANFENAGKVVIDGSRIELEVEPGDGARGPGR
jgi:hypothetical protein